MSYGKYLIADLKVEMEVNGEMLRSRSEKYRAEFGNEQVGNRKRVIPFVY